jgi:hypothetical protein
LILPQRQRDQRQERCARQHGTRAIEPRAVAGPPARTSIAWPRSAGDRRPAAGRVFDSSPEKHHSNRQEQRCRDNPYDAVASHGNPLWGGASDAIHASGEGATRCHRWAFGNSPQLR